MPLQEFQTVAARLKFVESTSFKSSNFVDLKRLSFEPHEFSDYSDPLGFVDSEIEP